MFWNARSFLKSLPSHPAARIWLDATRPTSMSWPSPPWATGINSKLPQAASVCSLWVQLILILCPRLPGDSKSSLTGVLLSISGERRAQWGWREWISQGKEEGAGSGPWKQQVAQFLHPWPQPSWALGSDKGCSPFKLSSSQPVHPWGAIETYCQDQAYKRAWGIPGHPGSRWDFLGNAAVVQSLSRDPTDCSMPGFPVLHYLQSLL